MTKIEAVANKAFSAGMEAIGDIAVEQRWASLDRESAAQVVGELQELLDHARSQVELMRAPVVVELTQDERAALVSDAQRVWTNYQDVTAQAVAQAFGCAVSP